MGRVMIVDDDGAVLDGMSRLLKGWGHDVVAFADFEHARASLESGPPPDVLLVDVRLGMFNGLQLMHLAKQIKAAMIVIAVSGFDDPVLRAEAKAAGAAYLVKPVDLTELRRLLPST